MEPIRYRPGEAIRWIKTGAQTSRRSANERGRDVIAQGPPQNIRDVGRTVANAAGAIADLGKSAWADLKHGELESTEYVLLEQGFDIVKGASIKSIPYDRVQTIHRKGDRLILTLDKGTISVRPHAYLVSGPIKVPVGWSRNGMEVPYELFSEELAARCGVNIEDS